MADWSVHRSIHPYSVLSHIYFDNVLCMDSFTSPDGRTTQGIRVGFTENSGTFPFHHRSLLILSSPCNPQDEPESTEFVIYGQLCPSTSSLSSPVKSLPSTSTSEPPQVRMIATRILSSPPPASPATRPPRPDDPTPRKPPAHLLFSKNNPTSGSSSASAKRKREVSSSSALSSSCSSSSLLTFGESSKRVKKELGGKGKGRDYGEDESGSGVVKKSSRGNMSDGFKVPSLPSRSYSQPSFGGSGGKDDVDVFGSIPNGGGGNGRGVMNGLDELEKANKTVRFTGFRRNI